MTRSKRLMAAYSILSSARSNNDSGIVNPNAFAVLSLSASSNLLAAQNACLCVAHATTHQNASSVRHGQLPAAQSISYVPRAGWGNVLGFAPHRKTV